jgi:hypothetical protein
MKLKLPIANNRLDFLSSLQGVDISVPERTKGRLSDDTERWLICHLLSALATADLLQYPLSMEHRDRPDFYLQSDSVKIGIEATEAVSEQYAAFVALAKREFPGVLIEPAHFKYGAQRLTLDEMRSILGAGSLTAEPWIGKRPERDWSSYMTDIIEIKAEKLLKSKFEKYENNWLAIYDNLPLHGLEIESAVDILQMNLLPYWSCETTFDSIFIEHQQNIIHLSAGKVNYLPIKDLWQT